MTDKKLTAKSTLRELLEHKRGQEVMAKYNVPCLTCPMAAMEMNELQVGQICEMYGIDLVGLLKDINQD